MPDASAIRGPVPRGTFTLLVKISVLVAIVFFLAPGRYFDSLLVVLFVTLLIAALVYRIFAKPPQVEGPRHGGGAVFGEVDDSALSSSDVPGPIEPR